MKIGIDVDGVIIDFEERIKENKELFSEKEYNELNKIIAENDNIVYNLFRIGFVCGYDKK